MLSRNFVDPFRKDREASILPVSFRMHLKMVRQIGYCRRWRRRDYAVKLNNSRHAKQKQNENNFIPDRSLLSGEGKKVL